MPSNIKSALASAAIALILATAAVALLAKIDLNTADLGRHIKNGEVILKGPADLRSAVLHKNFYSYTEPDQPFINHHWLSGVVFYLIKEQLGWSALSLFYVALVVGAFYLAIRLARKSAGDLVAVSAAALALPMIAARVEIRPEMFTLFFVVLFLYIAQKVKSGELSDKWLFLLPAIEILWVNLHIGFIFGIFIVGLHTLTALADHKADQRRAKKWALALCLTTLCAFINPSFIKGALVPFTIFNNYGYKVVENQSIPFLQNINFNNQTGFPQVKIAVAVLAVAAAAAAWLWRREWRKIPLEPAAAAIVFGYMAWTAVRNIPLFGLFFVVAGGMLIKLILDKAHTSPNHPIRTVVISSALMALLAAPGIAGAAKMINDRLPTLGAGLLPGVENAAAFFKSNNLKGPVFNNYDNGTYLIYELFPKERVFYDNRPEAYSERFSQDVYVASMQNPELFKSLDKKYSFNAIFFYYHDYTPWGQEFIAGKVFDPEWAPVYADNASIILLKRDQRNAEFIKAHELPKETFTVNKTTN
jgi:hypothetical protein